MDCDTEQLNLLAIFHYVVAGLAALFSFPPALHDNWRHLHICRAARNSQTGRRLAPRISWLDFCRARFAVVLIGIAMAICILIAGRSLALRKRYSYAFIMACIECLFIPFGTILGVFTIVVLSRESVRALFSTATAQAPN